MRILRLTGALVAVVACAWFVLGARQAHEINQVTSLVGGIEGQQRLTPAQAARANSLLDSAGTLDPDRQVDVLRARVALLSGERPRATRILLGVVSAEPDDLIAWYGLATSATAGPLVARALGEIARLEATPG